MRGEIKRWKVLAVSIGHIAAIVWFWFVIITSFNDFKAINREGSPLFGFLFASAFTLVSALICNKFIKQFNLSKRIYYYNILIVIFASIVIFMSYFYMTTGRPPSWSGNPFVPMILTLFSIIPTILTKKILNTYEQVGSNFSRHSLEKWELHMLGAGHGVILLFALLISIQIIGNLTTSSRQSLIYIPFSLITSIIIYQIFKYNKLSKKFSLANVILLSVFFIINLVEFGGLRGDFWNGLFWSSMYGMLPSIPSVINIITIIKYGEYPTTELKEKEQIKEENYTENEEAVLKDIFLEIPHGEQEIRRNELRKPIEKVNHNVIDIKTAFGYKGATILYKLKIENNTSDPISDIKVYPYVPDVFLLKEKEKSIALIEQGSSQTVTFNIRPTGECGVCNISGRVNYYDMASRKRQDIELEQKSLSIVCPMLHGKEISETEWHDAVSNLVKTEESTREIDMPAESLFTMVSRVIKDMHMHMQKPEVTQNHKLFNGVARFYGEGVKGLKYAAQVEVVGGAKKSKLILKVWAEKEDALTGFYHGMLDEIEKRVNVKEYIDDSIVQYNVHIGDKIGTLVKDSVVQRSNIGASARKCLNCGREVEANEKFCLECGAKL